MTTHAALGDAMGPEVSIRFTASSVSGCRRRPGQTHYWVAALMRSMAFIMLCCCLTPRLASRHERMPTRRSRVHVGLCRAVAAT
jgi:hypothetical protein